MSRMHCNTDFACIDMPSQAVTRRESKTHEFIVSLNTEARDDILSAEVREFHVNNVFKVKSNVCVLVRSIKSLPVSLVRLMSHQPRVNFERGYTLSVQMKSKD